MKTSKLLLTACLALPLFMAACNKADAPDEQTAAEQTPAMSAPMTNDEAEWNAYLTDVVTRNLESSTSTFVYTLPPEDDADFQGAYDRQLEKASTDVSRGGVEGTLLAFGSPSSARSADMAVAAFQNAVAGSMKGVRVLFIGSPSDSERVRAAVEPSGATYVFVEAK